MNNRLFRAGELTTIKSNLEAIEKTLGEPIPGGIIDVDELKDHLLRPGEILVVCQNIKNIKGREYNRNYKHTTNPSNLELILFIAILGIGAFIFLAEQLFGIRLL